MKHYYLPVLSLFVFILAVFTFSMPAFETNLFGDAAHARYPGFSEAGDGFILADTFVNVQDDLIYSRGYYSIDGSDWVPYTFSGTSYKTSNRWLANSASANLPSFGEGEHYVIAYSCTQTNRQWNCHDGKWQLYIIEDTKATTQTIVATINVGSSERVVYEGISFAPDPLTEGNTRDKDYDVLGTAEDRLFQTYRLDEFTYNIPVEPGSYTITFYTLEPYFNNAGSRLFALQAEGQTIVNNLDILSQTNKYTPLIIKRNVTVSDGELTINTQSLRDLALLAGIAVETTRTQAQCTQVSDCYDGSTLTGERCENGKCMYWNVCSADNQCNTACSPGEDPDCEQQGEITHLSNIPEKQRLIVLLDINPYESGLEVDDMQSLIRLLLYANDIDIEGLVSTMSHNNYQNHPEEITRIINAYEQDLNNLRQRDSDYPSASYLRSVTKKGIGGESYNQWGVRSTWEPLTPGAQLIMDALAKDDPRPLWVSVWGDGATLAQALHYYEKERGSAAAQEASKKLILVDNAGQDNAAAWVAHNYPDALVIRRSNSFYGFSVMSNTADSSISHGGNLEIFSNEWLDQNIRNHGTLGGYYERKRWMDEGDNPAWMQVIPNGLSDPALPWQGDWGGRTQHEPTRNLRSPRPYMDYEKHGALLESAFDNYYIYDDGVDRWTYEGTAYNNIYAPVFRWREAYQNDFAARMDWADGQEGNHNPIAVLQGDRTKQVLLQTTQPGETITLDATGSNDPDGNSLSYRWWHYKEAGTYSGTVSIANANSQQASITVPNNAQGTDIHILLEITDNGNPPLTSYRRLVVRVQ